MKDLKALSEVEIVFNQFMKDVGLDQSGGHITYETATMDARLGVYFHLPIDRFMLSNKPFVGFFRDLKSSIVQSPLVQHEIKLVEDKLKMANAAADELLERIKELEKYKTHYELEMKLRHGDSK